MEVWVLTSGRDVVGVFGTVDAAKEAGGELDFFDDRFVVWVGTGNVLSGRGGVLIITRHGVR